MWCSSGWKWSVNGVRVVAGVVHVLVKGVVDVFKIWVVIKVVILFWVVVVVGVTIAIGVVLMIAGVVDVVVEVVEVVVVWVVKFSVVFCGECSGSWGRTMVWNL